MAICSVTGDQLLLFQLLSALLSTCSQTKVPQIIRSFLKNLNLNLIKNNNKNNWFLVLTCRFQRHTFSANLSFPMFREEHLHGFLNKSSRLMQVPYFLD